MNGLPEVKPKRPTAADQNAAALRKAEDQAKITYSKGDRGKGQAGPARQTRPKV